MPNCHDVTFIKGMVLCDTPMLRADQLNPSVGGTILFLEKFVLVSLSVTLSGGGVVLTTFIL